MYMSIFTLVNHLVSDSQSCTCIYMYIVYLSVSKYGVVVPAIHCSIVAIL